ncbi:metallophosphoesterase [Candidatus Nomurabacteria bacterium]|nr:metallophosphoesterase [Candidatus Nomurabacteria bacterium]
MEIAQLFDTAIWSLVIFGLVVELAILMIPFLRNRAVAQKFFIFVFFCQIIVLYGSFVEPRMITVNYSNLFFEGKSLEKTQQKRYFIPRKTPARDTAVRIALVTDWHVGPYKQSDFVARAVKVIEELEPDVVLMPGDFIYNSTDDVQFLEPLSTMTDIIPFYATLGNHDYHWSEQREHAGNDGRVGENDYSRANITALESYGVTVLENETIDINIDGHVVELVGQEDWWSATRPDVEEFFSDEKEDADRLSILLQHNPDGAFFQTLPKNIELVVSGHTHGGQIRLPFIGPLWDIPTEVGNEYDQGWFTLPDSSQKLFITHGIGETGPRARLFAWPEVVVFDIGNE